MNFTLHNLVKLACQTGFVTAFGFCLMLPVTAQPMLGTENGEWRYLGGNVGHTRYSPLDQINRENFEDLEIAWIFHSDNFG
ncbi:uncharacterized protein METZ01_LOCUS348697, partial [marine metagenome]